MDKNKKNKVKEKETPQPVKLGSLLRLIGKKEPKTKKIKGKDSS